MAALWIGIRTAGGFGLTESFGDERRQNRDIKKPDALAGLF
jgi:hypothetical protein